MGARNCLLRTPLQSWGSPTSLESTPGCSGRLGPETGVNLAGRLAHVFLDLVQHVLFFLFFLLVLAVVGYRASTPAERERYRQRLGVVLARLRETAGRLREDCEPFDKALRARARWLPLTSALIVLHTTVFVLMLSGPGAIDDPQTLVDWGGSYGPRTTNGEWWRLLTAMFVCPGTLYFLVCLAGLVQVGPILERLVGRSTFAVVYVTSGIFASLVSLAGRQVAVNVGPAGAIFGLYGLLIASSVWALFPRSSLTIPLAVWKKLGPVAAVFVVFHLVNDAVSSSAELAGLGAGCAWGLALTHGIGARKPALRPVAVSLAVALALAALGAVSLRGITDVRPEIEKVVAVEDRTARAYQTAADLFRKRRMTAESLAQLIEQTILPELLDLQARLEALAGVPPEHRPFVADAEEYARLRTESWRLRAEGLRQTGAQAAGADRESGGSARLRAESRHAASVVTLGKAEGRERASLEALERIRPVHE